MIVRHLDCADVQGLLLSWYSLQAIVAASLEGGRYDRLPEYLRESATVMGSSRYADCLVGKSARSRRHHVAQSQIVQVVSVYRGKKAV